MTTKHLWSHAKFWIFLMTKSSYINKWIFWNYIKHCHSAQQAVNVLLNLFWITPSIFFFLFNSTGNSPSLRYTPILSQERQGEWERERERELEYMIYKSEARNTLISSYLCLFFCCTKIWADTLGNTFLQHTLGHS